MFPKPDYAQPDPTYKGGKHDIQAADLVSSSPALKTILIVEDNFTTLSMLKDYLEFLRYRVIHAEDGQDGIDKAVKYAPDLILMDIKLPGLDGLEATRYLRTLPQFSTTPIIAMTAHVMPGDKQRCLAAGANLYLPKPFRVRELGEVVGINIGSR